MKRLFKLAMVFVLSGAALLNVGCTKDYGEEIASVKKDLENLKTGTVADHTTQIAAIELTIKDLQAMDETLQKEIDALAEAIQKIPTDTAIVNLRNRVTELEKCSEANKKDIATLQGLVADKADKSWVELTFATKDALGQVAEDLGKLTTTVSEIDAAYKKADGVLQGQINQIKEDITTLQGKVENLELAIADRYTKGEVDGLIQGVKLDLADMEKKLQENIDAEAKARKEGDEALAETIENEVKKLQGQIDEIKNTIVPALEKADEELEAKILEVEKNLGIELLARMSGDKALNDSIDVVVKMYQDADGILQQQITNLEQAKTAGDDSLNVKINEEINARIAAIKDTKEDLEAFVTKLVGISDTSKGSIKDMLDEEIETRSNEIQRLEDLINEMSETTVPGLVLKVKEIQGDIAALAIRVTSISVCPTKEDEIITIKVGDTTARMFKATFEVEPVAAAAAFTKENVVLTYTEARPRTKAASINDPVSYKEAVIDSVYADAAGRVTVIAKNIDTLKSNTNACFFALTYNGADKASKYSVTSDYAQALESDDVIDLISYFKYSVRGVVSIAKTIIVPKTVDYIIAAKDTTVFQPFKDLAIVYNNAGLKNFIPEQLTPEEFTEWTGLELNFVPEYSIDYPLTDVELKELNSKDRFDNTVDLSQYVRKDPYYFILEYTINNEKFNRQLKQQTMLTGAQHGIVDLETLYLYWNYKTYKAADRIASKKVSEMTGKVMDHGEEVLIKDLWKDLTEDKGAKAIKQLDFNGAAPSKFKFGVWDATAADYLDELTAEGVALPGPDDGEKIYRDTLVKVSTSDSCSFAVKVFAQAHMPNQIRVFPVTVKGSVTKTIDLTIEKVLESVLKKKGTTDPRLISGLTGDDAKYENVFAAASDCYNAATFTYKVDGVAKDGFTQVWDSANDKLTVTVPAGILNYAKTSNVDITVSTIFGFQYTITIKATTEAAPFEIRVRPYAKDGIVRGKFKTESGAPNYGRYTIDDLNYNWQVELVPVAGKEFSDINEDANCIAATFGYTPEANVSGKPDITANPVFVDFAQGDKTYKPLENGIMKWSKYDGLNLNMSAQLVVVPGGALSGNTPVNVNAPVTYTLKTVKPVEWETTVTEGKTIVASTTYTKVPATPLQMDLFKGIKVNGADQEGKITVKDIMSASTGENVDPLYKGESDVAGNNETKFVFTVGTTLDATYVYEDKHEEKVVLTQGVDYEWYELDLTHHNSLVLLKDNLKANLRIDVPVQLNYYLDYSHTQANKGYVTVIIKQN